MKWYDGNDDDCLQWCPANVAVSQLWYAANHEGCSYSYVGIDEDCI